MNLDLKWLAENVTEWHNKLDRIARQSYGPHWFDQERFPYWEGFTRDQWQAARDELAVAMPDNCNENPFDYADEESPIDAFERECNQDSDNDPFSTPEEDEAWAAIEKRIDAMARNGNDGDAYPAGRQLRYQDEEGGDWIDEAARTLTPQEFRGAMRFSIGKYNRRMGKKDDLISEIEKMRDYCTRWLEVEQGR